MVKMSPIDWIAWILVIIGAINWGLVGLLKFDLIAGIFGQMTMLCRIAYIIVGLAGIWMIYHKYMALKGA